MPSAYKMVPSACQKEKILQIYVLAECHTGKRADRDVANWKQNLRILILVIDQLYAQNLVL